MNREERTLRVVLDAVDFARLCDLADVYECTPTALAAVAIPHVLDELAKNLERE